MEITPPPAVVKKQHSVFGVISFGIGMVSLTLVCGGLAMLIFLIAVHQGRADISQTDAVLTTLCMVMGGPLAILGIGGGMAGFFEVGRRRVFNWLGIILNGLSLLALAAMLVYGFIERGPRSLPPNL